MLPPSHACLPGTRCCNLRALTGRLTFRSAQLRVPGDLACKAHRCGAVPLWPQGPLRGALEW